MNPNPSATGQLPNGDPALTKIYAKINLRLLPFLLLCYFFAYLDRVNIGFAKLQMQSDLGMSDAVYGFAAGIFFLGYVMFEVPSNLLLEKIGARKSIARIMVLWGLTSASMLFVTNETSFYILRFLLGVFEAGFAPGMIFYLTYWYSGARMARVMSIVMLAGPLGGMLGGPVSAWIMATMSDSSIMAGWQWLFLIEGLPCVFLGVMAFYYLDDKPGEAKWLSTAEKALLVQDIGKTKETSHHGFKTVLRDPWVYLLAFAYFCLISGIYAIAFWLPTLISGSGITDLKQVGLYSAIPYVCAAVFMWWFAKSSDKHQERRWHSTLPALFAAIALALAIVFGDHFAVSLAAISLATGLMWAAYTVFWAIPSQYLEGSAAAGGIALINSIGLLGGLVSPMLMGFVKEATGSLMAGWFSIAAVLALGALTLLFVAQKKKK